eukprot:SAG31_NODE_43532_length_266_cov_1.844311_1_plen_44_part_10
MIQQSSIAGAWPVRTAATAPAFAVRSRTLANIVFKKNKLTLLR